MLVGLSDTLDLFCFEDFDSVDADDSVVAVMDWTRLDRGGGGVTDVGTSVGDLDSDSADEDLVVVVMDWTRLDGRGGVGFLVWTG